MNPDNQQLEFTLLSELLTSEKVTGVKRRSSSQLPLGYRSLSVALGSPIQAQHNIAQDGLRNWLHEVIDLSDSMADKISRRYASYNSYCLPEKVALLKEKDEGGSCNVKELLNCFRIACAFEDDRQQHHKFIEELDRKVLFGVIVRAIPSQLTRVEREAFLTDSQDGVPSLSGLLAGLNMVLGDYVRETEQVDFLGEDHTTKVDFDVEDSDLGIDRAQHALP